MGDIMNVEALHRNGAPMLNVGIRGRAFRFTMNSAATPVVELVDPSTSTLRKLRAIFVLDSGEDINTLDTRLGVLEDLLDPIDTAPTANSQNFVYSGGVYSSISALNTALGERISDLEDLVEVIDETPTENSTNFVKSGGVWSDLQALNEDLTTLSDMVENDSYWESIADNDGAILTDDSDSYLIDNWSVKSVLLSLTSRVTSLEQTIGSSTSGLILQLNRLTSRVASLERERAADDTSYDSLSAQVDANTSAIADNAATIRIHTTNIASLVTDKASVSYVDTELAKKANTSVLSSYLTTTVAASTYLTKTDAASTYLTATDAATTYLTPTVAGNTYLTKTAAASTYLSKTDAASTYIAQIASDSLMLV